MFRIDWLRADGKRHDIGGAPFFAPKADVKVSGEYVLERIWPQIQRDHPELSGFALVDTFSQDEVFRWQEKP
jgi:hypothetical protein